jgi:uncharacterized protein with ParB-like and HNH nuclease domain
MKANETKVENFLSSNKTQFIIPVYQRNYDWTTKQCKRLLDDIIEVGGNKKINAHFIGSIVYIHDDAYTTASINELTVIDGQQRLTTITLIYLALCYLAKSMNNNELVDEITETYLINKYATEEEKLKLRQTDNNDKALKYLLRNDNNEFFSAYSKLVDNFNYFKSRIIEENHQTILRGLSKLMFVEISLDRNKDDPQRIFESLNSTGLDLSQADLIRNYILMGLNRHNQNKIHQNYWEAIEKSARDEASNESKISDFIRDFLTLENKKIPNKGNVYLEFKEKYPIASIEELEDHLLQIKKLVIHYNKLLNPQRESDKDIRRQLEYINQLEINVAYPFLMKVYEDYNNHIINKNAFIDILNLIQSFAWRRFIVGLPTNALNKIFMSLYDKVDASNYLYSIRQSLLQRSSSQRFPRNAEVVNALKEKDIYNINNKNITYFLDKLENYQNMEIVKFEGLTIEHIFPQNPDPKWKTELGDEEYNFIKENYLHTIGNLTLSGNNGALSNKSFVEKRDMNVNEKEQGYKFSRLWLNRDLKEKTIWNKHEIEERTKMITERFLKIWEFPDIRITFDVLNNEVNIFEADDPTGKKMEYYIFFDQRVEVRTISELYINIFKQLFDLQPELFFNSSLKDRIVLSNSIDIYRNRNYEKINETYYICVNYSSVEKIERIKEALTLFGFEDELIIKYAVNDNE